ncbi:DUF4156 domain-containing protein [Paracoccaceae bacterium GXU_MW_L88]
METQMRFVSTLSLVLAMAACSTDLSSEASNVRQISLNAAESCQFLGGVTGSGMFGMTEAMDTTSAYNQLRNSVSEMGGNAFVVSSSSSSMESAVVQADAYDC